MSPVARNDRHAGKALLVAGVGVGFAIGVAFLFSVLANRGDVEVRLGDDLFDAGQVESISGPIDETGIPLIFPDAAFGGRPIHVQHLGDDPQTGWLAFSAFDPNDAECIVEWVPAQALFVNQCDPSLTYPPDGTGLRQYPTTVTDGRLLIDLNSVERRAAEQDAENRGD
ncbi:MAG TPA: hypothetical protein VMW08_09085 [Acidimicrobiales bacterium]|nr:hypothetical protein [Acidimicrobiales bacterium]